jgi:hypothetical protein
MILNKFNTYFLSLLLLFSSAIAQDTDKAEEKSDIIVEAQVSAKSFYMGEAFTFTILVDGSNKVQPPHFSKLANFSLKRTDVRPLTSKEKPGFVIRYEMVPLAAGSLVIPELQLLVNGKTVMTKEIRIKVAKPAEHPGLTLSLVVSKKELFVGEPFLLTFTWRSEVPLYSLKAVDVRLPFNQKSVFLTTSPYNSPEGGSKDTIGLPVSDVRTICKHEITTVGKKRIETLSFSQVVRPRYAGEFTLEPASLLCSFIPPSPRDSKAHQGKKWKPNYPSYFNNNFFEEVGNIKHEKYISRSNKVELIVKDLPSDGRPDDFFGVVGKCSVSTKASSVIVEEGTPIHLAIKIADYDFPSILKMPDMSRLSTFNRNFSIPRQKSSGSYDKKSKIFTQTLRPLRTDVNAIPPVRIPYFDPTTKTYNIAQSAEIAITVKPAGKVTAFQAILSSGTNLKNIVVENPEGIRHNTIVIAALNTSTIHPLTLFILTALIPPVLYLIFFFASAKHRLMLTDPAAARSLNAYKSYNSKVSHAVQDISILESITRTYFADKLKLTKDAHTCDELLLTIKTNSKLSKDEVRLLTELYQAFDKSRFDADKPPLDLQELVKISAETIKTLNGRIENV